MLRRVKHMLTRINKLLFDYYKYRKLARSILRFCGYLAFNGAPSNNLLRGNVDRAMNVDKLSLLKCDILVQVDNFEAGGLENVVLDLNQSLIGAGYQIVLLVLGNVGLGVQRAREQGMTVIIGSFDLNSYSVLIGCLKPQLVLSHYSIHGVELCAQKSIPFIQVIHNIYMWFDSRQVLEFANAAQKTTVFIAVSEYVKKYSVSRLGVDNNYCVIIPNGIDGATFDNLNFPEIRHKFRELHRIDDKDFVFLSVGAVNHQKNHIATIRSFASVATEMPRAKLIILGPMYERNLLNEIQYFVKKNSLNDRIIYAGSASGAQKYFAMADAFVLASFFEGGPLVFLEALKANLPIIATNVGFVSHFKGMPGITILEPLVDIMEFHGAIWELASTPTFEERLANAMVEIYADPQRPNLPANLLQAFDKSEAYKLYVVLIDELLQSNDVSNMIFPASWPNWINEYIHHKGIETFVSPAVSR